MGLGCLRLVQQSRMRPWSVQWIQRVARAREGGEEEWGEKWGEGEKTSRPSQ